MSGFFKEIFTEKTDLILQHFPVRASPPQIHTHVTEKKYMDLLESYNDLRTSYVKYTSELIDQIDRLEQLKDRQIDHIDRLEQLKDRQIDHIERLENRTGNLKNHIDSLEECVRNQDNRYNELLEVIKNYRRMLVERNVFIDKLLNKLNSGFLSRLFS